MQFKDYIGRVTKWGTKFVSAFQNFLVRPVGIHSRILILSARHSALACRDMSLSPVSHAPKMFILHLFDTQFYFSFLLIVYINEQTCQRNSRFPIGTTRNSYYVTTNGFLLVTRILKEVSETNFHYNFNTDFIWSAFVCKLVPNFESFVISLDFINEK